MELKFKAWNGDIDRFSEPFCVTNNILHFPYVKSSVIKYYTNEIIVQFTGLYDKENTEIYADDILGNGRGEQFRVYSVPGGFAIKAPAWAKDKSELKSGDELIMQPLCDAQMIGYISESCKVVGNVNETISDQI